MCKTRQYDGEVGHRCFNHTYEDYQKNAERIDRDTRIQKDGSERTPAEDAELKELLGKVDTLDQKEKNRVSVLTRIGTDGSTLLPTEVGKYKSNLKKNAELATHLDFAAATSGAARAKQLSMIQGEIIERAVKTAVAKDGKIPVELRNDYVRDFISARSHDPDVGVTDYLARKADVLFRENPDLYKDMVVYGDNGKKINLTPDVYAETQEMVRRHRELSPNQAPKIEQEAYAEINALRAEHPRYFSMLAKIDPNDPRVAKFPPLQRAAIKARKVNDEILARAIAQDRRVELYGQISEEALYRSPQSYKRSPEKDTMDAARASLPPKAKDAPPFVIEDIQRRRAVIADMEANIAKKNYGPVASQDFLTTPPTVTKPKDASNAALNASAKNLSANSGKKTATQKADTTPKDTSREAMDSSASELRGSLKGNKRSVKPTQTQAHTPATAPAVATSVTPNPAVTTQPAKNPAPTKQKTGKVSTVNGATTGGTTKQATVTPQKQAVTPVQQKKGNVPPLPPLPAPPVAQKPVEAQPAPASTPARVAKTDVKPSVTTAPVVAKPSNPTPAVKTDVPPVVTPPVSSTPKKQTVRKVEVPGANVPAPPVKDEPVDDSEHTNWLQRLLGIK